MSESLAYQGLLSSNINTNLMFLPYTSNHISPTSTSLMGPKTSSWLPNQCPPLSFGHNANPNNLFTLYGGPKTQRDAGDLEVARYLRQLAECKLKELDFQKAQVQLLKESLPLCNPVSSGLSIPTMNYLHFPNGAPPPSSYLQEVKTPIVPSPLILSSYQPTLSPFASHNPAPAPPPPQSPRLENKMFVHPGLSEVVNLFPPRKSFICPEAGCGKALKTRLGLERHSRNHTGGRRFVCNIKGCNKKFLESNTLKRHIRIHTGEKPFLCPAEGCGRSFSDGSNYRRHLSTHSKEKPFKCPFVECKVKPFGFTRAATLRTHLLNFHNVKLCQY